jgi:hypothetical protein
MSLTKILSGKTTMHKCNGSFPQDVMACDFHLDTTGSTGLHQLWLCKASESDLKIIYGGRRNFVASGLGKKFVLLKRSCCC